MLTLPDKPDAASVSALLGSAITEAGLRGDPGVYAARDSGGVGEVVPTAVRDATGALVQVTPILDTKIRLPFEEQLVGEVFENISKQVFAATGTRVLLGSGPILGLATSRVSFAAFDEPARMRSADC